MNNLAEIFSHRASTSAIALGYSSIAFKKRKQKIRERKQIAAIDWPKIKEILEPTVRQGGCDIRRSCLYWATAANEYIRVKFGLDTHVWKGKSVVSWIALPNTEIRSRRKIFLDAATKLADDLQMNQTANYHVWLESREYIIDLSSYSECEPRPHDLLVIRRDEPTIYYYMPESEVMPKIVNGHPVYEIANHRITYPARPISPPAGSPSRNKTVPPRGGSTWR